MKIKGLNITKPATENIVSDTFVVSFITTVWEKTNIGGMKFPNTEMHYGLFRT